MDEWKPLLGGTVRNVDGVQRTAGILAVSRAFGNAGIKQCVKAEPEVTELDLAQVGRGLHSFTLELNLSNSRTHS